MTPDEIVNPELLNPEAEAEIERLRQYFEHRLLPPTFFLRAAMRWAYQDAGKDSARLDQIAHDVLSEGPELYPCDADVEWDATGNVVTKVNGWYWLRSKGATFREAIDAAIEERTRFKVSA